MLSKGKRKKVSSDGDGGMEDKNIHIPIVGKATFCVDDAGSHAVDANTFTHPLQGHALGQVLYASPCGAAELKEGGGRTKKRIVFAHKCFSGLNS